MSRQLRGSLHQCSPAFTESCFTSSLIKPSKKLSKSDVVKSFLVKQFSVSKSVFSLFSKTLADVFFNGAMSSLLSVLNNPPTFPQNFGTFALLISSNNTLVQLIHFSINKLLKLLRCSLTNCYFIGVHSNKSSSGVPQPLARFREFFAPVKFWVQSTRFCFNEFTLCVV